MVAVGRKEIILEGNVNMVRPVVARVYVLGRCVRVCTRARNFASDTFIAWSRASFAAQVIVTSDRCARVAEIIELDSI